MKKMKSCHDVSCVQCGRPQKKDEGCWMLCQRCGTFRCPSCFGNVFESVECPECRDREEARQIVEFLIKSKKSVRKPTRAA